MDRFVATPLQSRFGIAGFSVVSQFQTAQFKLRHYRFFRTATVTERQRNGGSTLTGSVKTQRETGAPELSQQPAYGIGNCLGALKGAEFHIPALSGYCG